MRPSSEGFMPVIILLSLCLGGVVARIPTPTSSCGEIECINGGVCISDGPNPMCNCTVGYTGRKCEHRDPCVTNPCHSHGRCISNNLGQYRCACESGWTGEDCAEDVDECSVDDQSPCEHDGVCLNTPGSFICHCRVGFTGPRCEDVVLECTSQPCRNGGRCVQGTGQYHCECAPGFEGRHCEHEINECTGSPCDPNGQCQDLIGAYQCNCFPGWTGRHCETRVITCDNRPCQNNASCENIPLLDVRNQYMGFHCHCPQEFSGKRCETPNNLTCPSSIHCQNGGYCTHDSNEWKCVCPPGFDGRLCEERTVSVPPLDALLVPHTNVLGKSQFNCSAAQPCLNGGRCVTGDTLGMTSAYCQCPVGYTGLQCETRRLHEEDNDDDHDDDVCSTDQPCLYGGTCVKNLTAPDGYSCQCAPGFQGNRCEIKRYSCLDQPCGSYGRCVDHVNGYRCECLNDTHGAHCERLENRSVDWLRVRPLRDQVKQTPQDLCPVGACANGAQCVLRTNASLPATADVNLFQTRSRYTCRCDTAVGHFEGQRCDVDVDECAINGTEKSPVCLNGGQCVNTYGSYFCRCPSRFSGPRCEWKLKMCSSKHHPVCLNGGSCVEHGSEGFYCTCPPGFTGALCEKEIDECEDRPCRNGGICFDLIGSYLCLCPFGMTGRNCELAIDQIKANTTCNSDGVCDPRDCLNGGVFQRNSSETQCRCPPGYFGPRCEGHVNLCRLASHKPKSVWSNPMVEQQLVRWLDRTQWNYSGAAFESSSRMDQLMRAMVAAYREPSNSNQTNVVVTGPPTGLCHPSGVSQCIPQPSSFTCVCRVDFHGPLCEKSRDFCREAAANLDEPYCLNGGLCENQVTVNPRNGTVHGAAVCHCPAGYTGPRCQLFADVCAPNPCLYGGSCLPIVAQPTTSFEMNHSRIEQPFPGGPRKDMSVPAYQCHCPPDRAGRHCEVDRRTACTPESRLRCGQPGRCIAGPHGSKCNCPAGFCGTGCEKNGSMCAPLIHPELSYTVWSGTTHELEECTVNLCTSKRGNGQCDPECDKLACAFDGLECVLRVARPLQALDQLDQLDDEQHGVSKSDGDKKNIFDGSTTTTTMTLEPRPTVPWVDCSVIQQDGIPCHLRFDDGRCDEACASEACLFDGWDCETTGSRVGVTPVYEDLLHSTNFQQLSTIPSPGPECQSGCNNTECGEQYTCSSLINSTNNTSVLLGNLVLLIHADPTQLLGPNNIPTTQLTELLTGLSELLHLEVSLSRHAHTDRWMAYPVQLTNSMPYDNVTLVGEDEHLRFPNERLRRTARHANSSHSTHVGQSLIGSQLYLKLDATSCSIRGGSCFEHVDNAAQFLTAAMHHRDYTFLRPVLSVQSARGRDRAQHSSLWKPFGWLWSLNWPLYAILAIAVMLILIMLVVGGLFTANQLSQRQSSPHRKSLSAYLHMINKKRNEKKVQRAKIWFPEHGLLGRVRNIHKTSSTAGITTSSHTDCSTSAHPKHSFSSGSEKHNAEFDRLGLMWYLSSETPSQYPEHNYYQTYYQNYKQSPYDTLSGFTAPKQSPGNQVSTFLSQPADKPRVGADTFADVSNSTEHGHNSIPVKYVIKPEFHRDSTQPQYLDLNLLSGEHKIGVTQTANTNSTVTTTNTTNNTTTSSSSSTSGNSSTTTSTRVEASSDQDLSLLLLNNQTGDRSSTTLVSETWSFYQLIVRLLQSNGLEDLSTQHHQQQRHQSSTDSDACLLIRTVLQYTIDLDQQEQASAKRPTASSSAPVTCSNMCMDLHQHEEQQQTFSSFPRLTKLLDLRLPETGETLLHVAARLNQATCCTDLLDAGSDLTSVDNVGRTALLSAVSAGALEAIHAILTHPTGASSNPMCFVPSLMTDSTTPLIQAIKLGDADAFRMILHSMNILVCTLAKAIPTSATAPPSYAPSMTHLTDHPSSASNVSFGCGPPLKEFMTRGPLTDHPTSSTSGSGNEDNAMSLLDLNMTDSVGRTALHWAAATNQPEMISCLLEAGASLDVQTLCDETPLALAAREGALDACRLLLLAGANPDLADYLDRTPKQLAEAGGHEDIMGLFETSAVTGSSMMLVPSDVARSMGFHQDCAVNWNSVGHYNTSRTSRTRPSVENSQELRSGLFYTRMPAYSTTEPRSRGLTTEKFSSVSTSSSQQESVPKKLVKEQSTTRYTSFHTNEFSPFGFFEWDQSYSPSKPSKQPRRDLPGHKQSVNQKKVKCESITSDPTVDYNSRSANCIQYPHINHFEAGINAPIFTENQITSSDSESPNHWSSSPSDASPRHHQQQQQTRDIRKRPDFLTATTSFAYSRMNGVHPSQSCAVLVGAACNGNFDDHRTYNKQY